MTGNRLLILLSIISAFLLNAQPYLPTDSTVRQVISLVTKTSEEQAKNKSCSEEKANSIYTTSSYTVNNSHAKFLKVYAIKVSIALQTQNQKFLPLKRTIHYFNSHNKNDSNEDHSEFPFS